MYGSTTGSCRTFERGAHSTGLGCRLLAFSEQVFCVFSLRPADGTLSHVRTIGSSVLQPNHLELLRHESSSLNRYRPQDN